VNLKIPCDLLLHGRDNVSTFRILRCLVRGAVCLALCLLLPASSVAQLQHYEYSADAMGGAFSIALYSADRDTAGAAATAAIAELRRLDRMLSNYRPDSEWSEVNRHAADRAVEVSQELFDLLSACLEYSRRSEGAFDITVGPLVKVWGFRDESGRLAADASVQEALARVGYTSVMLDPVRRTVRFARAGVEMDPGGIGKGYAVDRMVGVLKRGGIERALVSAAGSSICALGAPPGREGWQVNIRAPRGAGRADEKVLLKDESVSTSGTSEKHFRSGGEIYGHIFDPRTGYPVRGVLQVSVVAPRALDSEAWTKVCFVNGRRWSAEHIPSGFRVFFCEEQAGHPTCSWIP
jgi:FAD:protein FMN transferase